jgi:hypothetical protein
LEERSLRKTTSDLFANDRLTATKYPSSSFQLQRRTSQWFQQFFAEKS